jgi:hypothetical protein
MRTQRFFLRPCLHSVVAGISRYLATRAASELDRTSGASIAREIRWRLYRRLSSSWVTRAVIEVRGEPGSTWAVIVTTASRGGETMQNWA